MKIIKSKLVVLLLFFVSLGNLKNAFCQRSVFSVEQYTNGKGDTLRYRQLNPDYDTLRANIHLLFFYTDQESVAAIMNHS